MTDNQDRPRIPKPAGWKPDETFLAGPRAGQRRCQAWSPNHGRQCDRNPIKAAKTCPSHGSAPAHVRQDAEARHADEQLEQKVQLAAKRAGLRGVDNPLHALSLLAAQILAVKDVLDERINALTNLETDDPAKLRGLVVLWERATDRAAKVLVDLVRLDIDGRLARIQEAQADVIIRAIDAALVELGLGDRQEDARRAVGRHLRAISSS